METGSVSNASGPDHPVIRQSQTIQARFYDSLNSPLCSCVVITLAILSTAADQPEAVRALMSYLGALGRKRIAELNAAQRAVLARLMMTPLET